MNRKSAQLKSGESFCREYKEICYRLGGHECDCGSKIHCQFGNLLNTHQKLIYEDQENKADQFPIKKRIILSVSIMFFIAIGTWVFIH